MKTSADYEIVIVGLGPVGAVAANLAGQSGLRSLVIERSETPYALPRAIVFDAEIMRIFDSIGLAEKISAVTRSLEGSTYLGADRQPIRSFRAPPRAHERAWHASNLFFQPELEGILRDGINRFPNVTILPRSEVTGVFQSAGGPVHTEIKSAGADTGRTITSNFLLACDGASSTVRKMLGIALDDIGFEERWVVVDTFVHGPMRWPETHGIPPEVRDGRHSLMLCDPARPSTIIPGVGKHRRWEYMLFPDEHVDDVIPGPWLRSLLDQWVDPADVEIIRSAVYRFRALIAHRWRIGSALLLGDAAHQTPPFYGQGMCHGIRDAAQLIWKLKLVHDGVAPEALLDSYQLEREEHVREIISASVAAGAAVCTTDPIQAAVRDSDFRIVERDRAGRTLAISDIVPPIRDGTIERSTGGVRLPELMVEDANGEMVTVDHLLSGRFALFGADLPRTGVRTKELGVQTFGLDLAGFSDGRPAYSLLADWLEERGAAWVVIRPDRYVHSMGTGPTELEAALDLLESQLRPTLIDDAHDRSKEIYV